MEKKERAVSRELEGYLRGRDMVRSTTCSLPSQTAEDGG